MKIVDRIYGEHEITQPVLIELINSNPLQRLKHINQAGASKYTNTNAQVTRYEHSIGVLILLQTLGASITEQIAGLLHDVPHTAFSHVIDTVLRTPNHDFHEQHHTRIIQESEIPEILKKYEIDINEVLNEQQHTLLERSAPDLCADRIDYTLRDTQALRQIDMTAYHQHLAVHNGHIVFTNKQAATNFAYEFIQSDKEFWANPRELAAYEILATCLQEALQTNLITIEDMWKTDKEIYTILKESDNQLIQKHLTLLTPNFSVQKQQENPDYSVNAKTRYIDPYILTNNTLTRASNLSEELKDTIHKHKQWHSKPQKIIITTKPQITL